jgi:hypothetical protein
MRNVFVFTILLGIGSFAAIGQDASYKLGIKMAPTFGSSRMLLDDPDVTIDNDGTSLKFTFGLVVDKYLSDSYVLSTGLYYMPKQVNIGILADPLVYADMNSAESYKLQYLQIPATLKLFTNEVKPDARVYFQLGMALEVKVYEEADPALDNQEVIDSFQPFNIPVILGTGFEYRAGVNTVLFGGISYQRGLTNVVKDTNRSFADELSIKSTILSVDLGVKF